MLELRHLRKLVRKKPRQPIQIFHPLAAQLPKALLRLSVLRSSGGQRPREQVIYLTQRIASIFAAFDESRELCALHREPLHRAPQSISGARNEGFLGCREGLAIKF